MSQIQKTADILLNIMASGDAPKTVDDLTQAMKNLQPLANQIRAQVAYGALTRRGWNVAMGFSYDVRQQILQSQLVQISYNGSCCGISVEYRRLTLLPVRTENQFRVSLNIANIGTFGNLRQQEKLF